jgi:hypothetical protein
MLRPVLSIGAFTIAAMLLVGAIVLNGQPSPAAADAPDLVSICHVTGSDTNPVVLIQVSPNAVDAHLAHGDFLANAVTGCQPTLTPTRTRTPTPHSPTATNTPTAAGALTSTRTLTATATRTPLP